MRHEHDGIVFEVPAGWRHDGTGRHLVLHGPGGEELIVSGARVEGAGTPEARQEVRVRLLENGLEAMRRAAADPELRKDGALADEVLASGHQLWMLSSLSRDRQVAFVQALLGHDDGVLLMTLEGPPAAATRAVLRRFAEGVRPTIATAGRTH